MDSNKIPVPQTLKKTFPTMASELIKELTELVEKYGDTPVAVSGDYGYCAKVYVDLQDYYYDGGYIVPIDDTRHEGVEYGHSHYIHSKITRNGISGPNPLLAEAEHRVIKLRGSEPGDFFDTIDGAPLAYTEYKDDSGEFLKELKTEPIRRQLIRALPWMTKEYQAKAMEHLKTFPRISYSPDPTEMSKLIKTIEENGGTYSLPKHTTITHIEMGKVCVMKTFLEWANRTGKVYSAESIRPTWEQFLAEFDPAEIIF